MSSTKPEVHNVFHFRQRNTEPRLRTIRSENFVKFGLLVFEICEQTERQTDKHTDPLIATLCAPHASEVIKQTLLQFHTIDHEC